MSRVSVVGTSGSGKTTIGGQIAARLEVPFTELDSIFHAAPGWVSLPDDEFVARVDEVIAGDEWVVDGNYGLVRERVWARADAVLWLDYPRWRIMRRIVPRSLRRVIRREELWNGNRETWRLLFSKKSVVWWAWSTHAGRRERLATALAKPEFAHVWVFRAHNPRQAHFFVHALPPGPARRAEDPDNPWRGAAQAAP